MVKGNICRIIIQLEKRRKWENGDEKTKKKVDFKKDVWYVSRKLDGVRCLIVVDGKGKAKSFSRAWKQFHTLSLVEKEIEELGVKNVVYDGEILSIFREKNAVKEVKNGLECGISLKDFIDFKEKDIIESYQIEKIERSIWLLAIRLTKDIHKDN